MPGDKDVGNDILRFRLGDLAAGMGVQGTNQLGHAAELVVRNLHAAFDLSLVLSGEQFEEVLAEADGRLPVWRIFWQLPQLNQQALTGSCAATPGGSNA